VVHIPSLSSSSLQLQIKRGGGGGGGDVSLHKSESRNSCQYCYIPYGALLDARIPRGRVYVVTTRLNISLLFVTAPLRPLHLQSGIGKWIVLIDAIIQKRGKKKIHFRVTLLVEASSL